MRLCSGTFLCLFICAVLGFTKATNHQATESLNENKYSEEVNKADKMAEAKERTFIMVKPDGVQRGLVPKIMARFTDRGYKLVALKMTHVNQDFAKSHYADLKTKPFFEGLTRFLSSGPVVATVWEGDDVVKQGRAMLGQTDPLKSAPGSIRGDYCIAMGRNVIHGSDSTKAAAAEISLWFKPEEVMSYKNEMERWIYE